MHIAIIGAGAAGCFAAIRVKELRPEADVVLYEGATRPLAKVAVTGGGRCNLTHDFDYVRSLEAVYPRGGRLMKRLFHTLDARATMRWFEEHGVRLVTQEDHCVFPQSQNAGEVCSTLLATLHRLGVPVRTGHRVTDLCPVEDGYRLTFAAPDLAPVTARRVIITTGGSPHAAGFDKFRSLGLEIIPPVPSLFTLTVKDAALRALTGTVVQASVTLAGAKLKAEGPLLITHRGVSGPAVLRLTSYGARRLAESGYRGTLVVNWLGTTTENDARAWIDRTAQGHPARRLHTLRPEGLCTRHWVYLIERAALRPDLRWSDLAPRSRARLAAILTAQQLSIAGRDPYKGEFVTCGGIALGELHPATLECRRHPGLYFAGEVTDVDALTGGFNLQAAWTMGYVAARGAAR